MIAIHAIQCSVTASFEQHGEKAHIEKVEVKAAQADGRWYGEGSMGVPFTEEFTQTELNLLHELLMSVASRIYLKKSEENLTAPLV